MASALRIRQARKSDLTALTLLVLTSFRQFSLFSHLYSPLRTNPGFGSDTLWYWRRRLWHEMLDPNADVLVAEVELTAAELPTVRDIDAEGETSDATERESRRTLQWALARSRGKDPQIREERRGEEKKWKYIVGFAIWNVRRPEGAEEETVPGRTQQSWVEWLEEKYIKAELKFWKAIYRRKDQDAKAYSLYLEAEEELARKCYSTETVYYLDNVTVDFRFQRRRIGRQLVEHGLAEAKKLGLCAMTEAGERGEGLYHKMGFEKVTDWEVCGMVLPVMKWTA